MYIRTPDIETDSPEVYNDLWCQKLDQYAIIYHSQFYNTLLSKSIRRLIKEIGVDKIKVVFSDEVYKNNPDSNKKETKNFGVFDSVNKKIIIPRIIEKYGKDDTPETYGQRYGDAYSKFKSDIDSYGVNMPATFAHEIRHFWQNRKGIEIELTKDSIRAWIIKDRVMEADATAFSALATWELKKESNLSVYFDARKESSSSDIFKAFEREISNGTMQATKSAFKEWYEYSGADKANLNNEGKKEVNKKNIWLSDLRKDYYEENMVKFLKQNQPQKDKFNFSKDVDVSVFLKNFLIEDCIYIEDLSTFIQTDKNVGLRKSTINYISNNFPKTFNDFDKENPKHIPERENGYDRILEIAPKKNFFDIKKLRSR
ncbi:MAG: DUF6782 family putative metallopeptidase [Alphaproteobacteria bacterium]